MPLLAAGLRRSLACCTRHRRGSDESDRVSGNCAVVACGCRPRGGGDDDDDDTAATEATTTEEVAGGGAGAAEISMTEYAFEPKNLTVSRGDTITVTNDGEEAHNYTVRGVKGWGDFTSGDVDPGSSTELTVNLDPGNRPGPFGVSCTIPGHASQGMEGTLMVLPRQGETSEESAKQVTPAEYAAVNHGQSAAEVRAILGEPEFTSTAGQPDRCWYYDVSPEKAPLRERVRYATQICFTNGTVEYTRHGSK